MKVDWDHDKETPSRDGDVVPVVDVAQPTERIGQAIVQFVAAAEAGTPLDRAALCAQYPDVADELAACLATFDFIHNVAPQLADSHEAPEAQPGANLSPLATLGDFRILRELGRGGMGVVYEVEQLSLGRPMAMKVLPFAAMLDRNQLQRFKNEARAAATLDHPHIVSVHSVGQERGVHYYAMQLIEGQSLAEVIRRVRAVERVPLAVPRHPSGRPETVKQLDRETAMPPPEAAGVETRREAQAVVSTLGDFRTREYFRSVARLGLEAARALDHAHQNGIVHRDVKPGNLLIDSSGHLWVTDFGLARVEADAGMTRTGDRLGTLAYMSPEQRVANRGIVDHRTDIYSLGATLYELLTLRTPYAGHDRQQLLQNVTIDEPPPLRHLNSRIPEDLETIVVKAIENDPEDRYATAAELADDLQRFLAERPIAAKRPTFRQRVTKWTRRNQGPVIASFVVLWLLILGSLTAAVMIWREKERTWGALEEASHQRQLAEERASDAQLSAQRARTAAKLAEQTIDEILSEFAKELEGQPDVGAVGQRMFLRAMGKYKQLLAHSDADPELRRKAGAAFHAAGMQMWYQSKPMEAVKLFDMAAEQYRALIQNDPTDDATSRIQLALALSRVAWCMRMRFDFGSAIKYSNEGLTVLQDRGGGAGEIERLKSLAECHGALGAVHRGLYWMTASDAHNGKAVNYYLQVCQEGTSDATVLRLAQMLHARGRSARHANWPSESEQHFLAAIDWLQRPAADPKRFQFLIAFRTCKARIGLSTVYTSTGNFELARRHLDESIAKLLELRRNHNEQTRVQIHLDWGYLNKAEFQFALGNVQAAVECTRRSVASRVHLFDDNEDDPDHRLKINDARFLLGDFLYAAGEFSEGAELLALAHDGLESIRQVGPDGQSMYDPLFIRLLAICPDQRIADPHRAIALIQTRNLTQSGPLTQLKAIAELQAGHYREAVTSCQAAMAMRDGGDAVDWLIMSLALAESGELQEAASWFDRQADAPSPRSPVDTLNCTWPQFERFRQRAARLLSNRSQRE